MKKRIRIKYGELTTKKGNRKTFINLLERNILNKIKNFKAKIIKKYDRMYIEAEENLEEIVNILKKYLEFIVLL